MGWWQLLFFPFRVFIFILFLNFHFAFPRLAPGMCRGLPAVGEEGLPFPPPFILKFPPLPFNDLLWACAEFSLLQFPPPSPKPSERECLALQTQLVFRIYLLYFIFIIFHLFFSFFGHFYTAHFFIILGTAGGGHISSRVFPMRAPELRKAGSPWKLLSLVSIFFFSPLAAGWEGGRNPAAFGGLQLYMPSCVPPSPIISLRKDFYLSVTIYNKIYILPSHCLGRL